MTESAFNVYVDLPGFKRENIKIFVDAESTLNVSAERFPSPTVLPGDSFEQNERPSGIFTRRYPLPATVDANTVNVKLEDGVLSLSFGLLLK
jgi:HSP20 family molecular chaperone IbpA